MKKEVATIESLIKGGLIGAVLGAFLSKDKEEGELTHNKRWHLL